MKRTLRLSSSCSEEIESSFLKELTLGYLNLADEMFDQAEMNFKLVIKYDGRCADAYWGLMLAKCQISSEEKLYTDAVKYRNVVFLEEYSKALELAEENQKKQFENLLKQIKKINEGENY